MKKTLVPFAETNQFSGLIDDYLGGDAALRPFYNYFPELASFSSVIRNRESFPCDRNSLADAILKQYSDILSGSTNSVGIVKNAISNLRNSNCFTVTTGHQLNLFTGPLFAIYKILTTIKLTRILSEQYPQQTFVPVFWMASEDHDFAEIDHINLFGKRITWKRDQEGAVGRMSLEGMPEFIAEVETILGSDSNCISLFKEAYTNVTNLSAATRKLMHGLFGKYGLVVIDGDDQQLKKIFVEEMKDDLVNHSAYKAVTETSKRLSQFQKIQVQPREINLFYLEGKTRNRIEKSQDGNYLIVNTDHKFTREQILKELEVHPEKFSPNVVLRPVYQEKILPNLAYIGGPGELNYWLQFKDAFEALKVHYPVFIPRSCMMLLPATIVDKTEKLGLGLEDLFLSTDFLVLKVLEKSSDVHVGTDSVSSTINKEFEKLQKDWTQLDPSLRSAIEAEKQKFLNSLAGLEEKARRAMKRKNETVVTQVKNMKEKLFPGGGLQERHENILNYYCRFGEGLPDALLDQIDPFEKKFVVLSGI